MVVATLAMPVRPGDRARPSVDTGPTCDEAPAAPPAEGPTPATWTEGGLVVYFGYVRRPQGV
ncbi:hypothetical protein GCM10022243_50610 [Saccharothrix violaceirubra]